MSISRATWPSRSPSSDSARNVTSVIIALGIDAVAIARFSALMQRRPGVVQRLFVDDEVYRADGSLRNAASLAARFAAKEAAAKALGAPAGLLWHDCRILTDAAGRPSMEVCGTVAAAARIQGIDRWHVSLTHDGDYAMAQVIAEGRKQAEAGA